MNVSTQRVLPAVAVTELPVVGFLHLTDMIDVIPADAIDPANGEETAADDRKLGYGDSGQHALSGNVHVADPLAV